MTDPPPALLLRYPPWLEEYTPFRGRIFPTLPERMRLAIELSRRNVEHGTGGPFGAAVFEMASGRLFSMGVNLVVSAGCSVLHAEITALISAQHSAGSFNLGGPASPGYELVTSTEPCAMCLGAVPWSGVRRLVCGARGKDAEAIGFDEGHKPAAWKAAMARRGIEVIRDVCRAEAVEVLRYYRNTGGVIYGGDV